MEETPPPEAPAEPAEKPHLKKRPTGVGGLVAVIIIIVLIVLGGVYYAVTGGLPSAHAL